MSKNCCFTINKFHIWLQQALSVVFLMHKPYKADYLCMMSPYIASTPCQWVLLSLGHTAKKKHYPPGNHHASHF